MSDTILVTYATCTGSTAGVAQAIAETLRQSGAQVEVRLMSEVNDLSPYAAVVAGSAIQSKQWLPEATLWLRAHRAELSQKPFAAFLVCMTLTIGGGKYRQEVSNWMQPIRAQVKPISEGLFAGALDISKIPNFSDRLKFRISVLFGVWK
jgi:menaquinone-dependent protoporphyrinogen oxidase